MARDLFFHIRFENGGDPAKHYDPDYDRVWKIKEICTLNTNFFVKYVIREKLIILHIIMREWLWISHTLRKGDESIEKQALDWNPHGPRSRGRPKQAWKQENVAKREVGGQQGRTEMLPIYRMFLKEQKDILLLRLLLLLLQSSRRSCCGRNGHALQRKSNFSKICCNKHERFGIKIDRLCDSVCYTCGMIVCLGKHRQHVTAQRTATHRTVLRVIWRDD